MKLRLLGAILVCSIGVLGTGCNKQEKTESKPEQKLEQKSEPQNPPSSQVVKEFTFEDGTGKWWPIGSVKVEKATNQKHTGNASAKISGSSPNGGWAYALTDRFPLEPGKKYKFTGWVLVESVSNAKYPPVLRVGMFQQKQKWLQNALTSKYDLSHKGEWQMFSTEFTAPGECDSAEISLEKGTQDSMTVTAYLDDLKIESAQ